MSILRNILSMLAAMMAFTLAVPVIVVAIPFLAVSYLVRLLTPLVEPKYIEWPEIFEFDSIMGWRARANLDCYCLEKRSDVFHVKTDQHGWPGSTRLEESDVIVFGDSHAFGYGVDHEKSFSQITSTPRIKAIGVPGYNMVQELMAMERLSSHLEGKMIVWFNYIGNDLYDNLSPEMNGYRAPFVRQTNDNGQWEIVTSHLAATPWTCSAGTRTLARTKYPLKPALHSESFLARRAYSACESLIQRAATLCNRLGSRLVVMSIPDTFALAPQRVEKAQLAYPFLNGLHADYPDGELSAICRKVGVQFIALKKYLDHDDYQPRDDHWTERGHRRVAKVLRELYCEHLADSTGNLQTVVKKKRSVPEYRCVSQHRLFMNPEEKNAR